MAEEQPLPLMMRVRSYSHVRFGKKILMPLLSEVDTAVEDRSDLCGMDISTGAHRYGTPIGGTTITHVS
jgi:hypothetical protein